MTIGWIKIAGAALIIISAWGIGYKSAYDKRATEIADRDQQITRLETDIRNRVESELQKDRVIKSLNEDKNRLVNSIDEQNNSIEEFRKTAAERIKQGERKALDVTRKYETLNAYVKSLNEIQSKAVDSNECVKPEVLREIGECRRAVEINNKAEKFWR